MREDDSSWFSKWEDDLPAPEDLMPLSQSLITPDLALAFNISDPHAPAHHSSKPNFSAEPARTLKRPRLVWTPQLHKKFVDAVAQLGIKNAVPKTIMQHMRVDGLTRENVASHLQKYRLYLKRVQSISGGPTAALPSSGVDSATDRLFASLPVPAHFLHPGRPGLDDYHHHYPQPQFSHFDNSYNVQFQQVIHHRSNGPNVVPEDLGPAKGKKVLTLFPID